MFYIYFYFLKGSCESLFTNMIVLLTQDSNVMVSCIPTITIYLSKIWYIRLDSIDKNIVYHIHSLTSYLPPEQANDSGVSLVRSD